MSPLKDYESLVAEVSPIILISGPPGAGKSTVARLIVAGSDAPVAYVEGDTFWHFIAKPRTAASKAEARIRDSRIIVRAMIAAAVRYAHGGYETVLDFTIGPWALKSIQSALKETPLDYVVLCPSESVCSQRAAGRADSKFRHSNHRIGAHTLNESHRTLRDGSFWGRFPRHLYVFSVIRPGGAWPSPILGPKWPRKHRPGFVFV
jgi:adenylate kinase family enzyme